MGIVWGIFDILCLGGCAGYIPTALFAKNPTIWVNAMSTYKCGMTAAPDTMWRTICGLYQDPDRRAGLDFSSLRVAVDGSEPVNTTTQPLLAATFGECGWTSTTLTPMYGLAEGGLAMSGHLGPREAVCVHFDAPTAARGQIVPADLNPADPLNAPFTRWETISSAATCASSTPIPARCWTTVRWGSLVPRRCGCRLLG
ncbi:MAG: AMP-binding protein [Lawsonella clevelandensis]